MGTYFIIWSNKTENPHPHPNPLELQIEYSDSQLPFYDEVFQLALIFLQKLKIQVFFQKNTTLPLFFPFKIFAIINCKIIMTEIENEYERR
jgi:hypothetical protein